MAYENSVLYSEHTWGDGRLDQRLRRGVQETAAGQLQRPRRLVGRQDRLHPHHRPAHPCRVGHGSSGAGQAVNTAAPALSSTTPCPGRAPASWKSPASGFRVENVPASGYKTIPVPAARGSQTCLDDTLENEFFKVKLDPARGAIASLRDKRTGREWVDAGSHFGLGQYLNERFDKASDRQISPATISKAGRLTRSRKANGCIPAWPSPVCLPTSPTGPPRAAMVQSALSTTSPATRRSWTCRATRQITCRPIRCA